MSRWYTVRSLAELRSMSGSASYFDWLYALGVAARQLDIDPGGIFDQKTARELIDWVIANGR